jgi:hypothetical protein
MLWQRKKGKTFHLTPPHYMLYSRKIGKRIRRKYWIYINGMEKVSFLFLPLRVIVESNAWNKKYVQDGMNGKWKEQFLLETKT